MIERLPFGATGHESTRIVFGAAALAMATPEEGERALELLLASGVNHIDAAASYGDAELRVGEWMPRHRGDFFLATKTGERRYTAARDQIRASLERLRTDHLDLIQLHNLTDDEGFEIAFSEDGALRAAVEARDEGLVRFIGVTGHGTRVAAMQLASLDRFDFASVLLPYNHSMMQRPDYAAEFETLLARCAERNVAVQTIKAIAQRRWERGEAVETTTWYRPFTDPADITRAVHWALARPGIFVNTASSLDLLPPALAAAAALPETPPDDAAMAQADAALGVRPLFEAGMDQVGRQRPDRPATSA